MSNYKLIGQRFLRKYTADEKSPAYNATTDAATLVAKLCTVPWEATGILEATITSHTKKPDESGVSGLDSNVERREKFDAALFCAEHVGGNHRAYANAACYRYVLPTGSLPHLTKLKASVTSDPYNSLGARIVLLTNSTGEIPMDCATVRGDVEGGIKATGVAPRITREVGGKNYWYPNTEDAVFSSDPGEGEIELPSGGLQLQKYLFVFVLLENYNTVRGNWLEGSSHIANNIEIETDSAITGWTDGGTIDLSVVLENEFNVCRGEKLPPLASNVSGVQMAESSFEGDVVDETSVLALRTAYGLLYKGEAAQLSCVDYPSLKTGTRPGAAFNVAAVRASGEEPATPAWRPSSMTTGAWTSLAYGDGMFVTGRSDQWAGIWKSTDGGLTWRVTGNQGGKWFAMTFDGTAFFASGYRDYGTSSTIGHGIFRSDDGFAWERASSTDSSFYQFIVAGGGTLVACVNQSSQNSFLRYSSDGGATMTFAAGSDSGAQYAALAYGGGTFIAGSEGAGIRYSGDSGRNFAISSITTGSWTALAYGDGVFVAGSGNNAGLWYSTDGGRTWTQSSKTTGAFSSLAYANGRFVAGSGNNAGFWYSTDAGRTWTQDETVTTGNWASLAYGDGRFVAGSGDDSGLWYLDSAAPTPTEDGLRWRIASSALFVRTSIPIDFHARKVRLDWADWSGTATAGSKFNVWVKPGDFSAEYDSGAIRSHVIYDATGKSAGGFELIGVIDATDPSRTATLDLPELTGQTATFLLTAYVSMDGVNPTTGMQLPIGAATELTVDSVEKTVGGISDTWRPDITLLG